MGMVGCFAAASTGEIDRLKANPANLSAFLHPEDDKSDSRYYVDVDKAWHAIHSMLSGTAGEPETITAGAVLGGMAIGEDLGYGPPRILSSTEVSEIANHLETLPPGVFATRYVPETMDAEGVYPEIWERDGAEGLSTSSTATSDCESSISTQETGRTA